MMQLYDAMILRVRALLEGLPAKSTPYEEGKAWTENADFEMIFQKDLAYELGGGKAMSANLTCVTEDPTLFDGDQVFVYGPNLQEIQGDISYARICEVLVKGMAEEEPSQILKLLQDIEFEKFHVYGKGFMMRTSGQSAREPVRVSKKALQDGISFERMGNTFISHYKKNPSVLAVRVSFVTLDSFDYEKLSQEAKTALEIRNSLSKIQKGLPTECSICDIREICNEVEGLRELHFGKKREQGNRTKLPLGKKRVGS